MLAALTLALYWVTLFTVARVRFGAVFSSPVQLVAGGLTGLALMGWLFHDSVASTRRATGIRIFLQGGEHRQAVLLLVMLSTMILLSAVTVSFLVGRRAVPSPTAAALHVSPVARRTALTLLPVPLAAIVVARGAALWRRPVYIENHLGGSLLASAALSAGLACLLALGFLWASGQARTYVVLMTAAYMLVFFGAGSRRFALVPILFAVGAFIGKPSRAGKIGLAVAALLSIYLIRISLELRFSAEHGIAPYWDRLPSLLTFDPPLAATALNLLAGFGIIQRTAYASPPIPTSDMWAAVNPLPGGLAGWRDVADFHRLNYFTPYAGVGELGNAGWAWVVVSGLLLGCVLAFLDLRAHEFIARGQQVAGLALVGLSAVILLFLTQYTLRTAMRMLYLAVAIAVCVSVWNWLRDRSAPTARTVANMHEPGRARPRK